MGHMSALGEVQVPMEVVDKLKEARLRLKEESPS
jgi:hypothetical protein